MVEWAFLKCDEGKRRGRIGMSEYVSYGSGCKSGCDPKVAV
jgi:hypothetical protein